MPALEFDEPSTEEITAAREVFETWNTGRQEDAIERLRPLTTDDRLWALSLMSWLYMQRGVPAMAEGIPYARRASDLGSHWAAVNLFNNLAANASSFPEALEPAFELISHAGPWWSGIDPVGQGWNLISQGRVLEGVRLMGLRSPFPVTNQEWASLGETARDQLRRIGVASTSASGSAASVIAAADEHLQAMEKARNDLVTRANQTEILVSTITSQTTGALFGQDAKRNETESKSAWAWGLRVLAAAAIVAVAPLALHYVGLGPDYSTGALLAAHAGSTAALATVAGVLLARARSRDVARQRATDLEIAMGTMITYSSQISDDSERQRFVTTMGQLVLQAHLTTSSPGHQAEGSLTELIALANLAKDRPSG